jgi:glutathione peroxidase
MSLPDIPLRRATGVSENLTDHAGKVLLVVNVASKCGFTPQYTGLQSLFDRFGAKGFEVLAFPCNQFGYQEPGDEAAITSFCETNYRVTFPLFAKIDVNGSNAHPLFTWLKKAKGGLIGSDIRWNFTKFLVDRSGVVQERFAPTTSPDKISAPIEALLG